MEQRILAISGKKQSGKTTTCNFITGTILQRAGLINTGFQITKDGHLHVLDIMGDTSQAGLLDIVNPHPNALDFVEKFIYPHVKIYSFADLLKKAVCVTILGLDPKFFYGTDEEKNSFTDLMWEDMPGVITEKKPDLKTTVKGRLGRYYDILENGMVYHEPGPMTGREVMQFVGTEIFRKFRNNVWAKATLRMIKSEGVSHALISDCRFPDELDVTHAEGGQVLRLTRDAAKGKDQHISETIMDKENYDWDNFDAIIDNENATVAEQNAAVIEVLAEWGW